MPGTKKKERSNEEMPPKFLKTLFTIPIYLRSEEQYNKEMVEAKTKHKEKYGEYQFGRKVEDFLWPQWEFNDIIGYIQVGIDPDGLFRFMVAGISGYERIPRFPMQRRKCVMRGIDYKEYFNKDIIRYQAGYLDIDLPITDIKKGITSFLRELQQKIEKESKYVNLDYWLKIVECIDYKRLMKYFV